MMYAAEGMGSLMPSAAVFSSDFVKEHSSYPTGDPQRARWIIPALGSLLVGINSRCEPGDASRKHSAGAFSGGGIPMSLS